MKTLCIKTVFIFAFKILNLLFVLLVSKSIDENLSGGYRYRTNGGPGGQNNFSLLKFLSFSFIGGKNYGRDSALIIIIYFPFLFVFVIFVVFFFPPPPPPNFMTCSACSAFSVEDIISGFISLMVSWASCS